MKKLFILIAFLIPFTVWANDPVGPMRKSNFSLDIEITSKYIWRGLEYGNAPVAFGTLGYNYKGLNVFALGGYALNGSHSEVDLGMSYSYKGLTIGVSDYFFPTAVGEKDGYSDFKKNETGHSMECYLTLAPSKLHLWMTLSTYFYGADKKINGSQAYSSYVELGYNHSFNDDNALSAWIGANLNKSFYTDYNSGLNMVNVAVKYYTDIPFGKYKLPVSGTFMYNPYKNKPYFSLSFYLN